MNSVNVVLFICECICDCSYNHLNQYGIADLSGAIKATFFDSYKTQRTFKREKEAEEIKEEGILE